jgi:hypothetical protein
MVTAVISTCNLLTIVVEKLVTSRGARLPNFSPGLKFGHGKREEGGTDIS